MSKQLRQSSRKRFLLIAGIVGVITVIIADYWDPGVMSQFSGLTALELA